MKQLNWINATIASATAYVAANYLYRYLVHDRAPAWSDLPDILLNWVFFALTYFGLMWFRKRRQERRAGA